MTQKLIAPGYWILICIMAVSAILSTIRINDCQMTVDEFFSINIAQRPLNQIWSLKKGPGFYFNNFPPLYESILHFVWRASKERLIYARFLSVFFNLAALCLIFLIARLLFDKKAGLLAASFASLNYSYLFFPKMIRCYSFLNFLILASFYIFFRMVIGRSLAIRHKIILLCVNTAILYTFYFGSIAIFLELILSCFFLSGKALRRIWLWLSIPFLFFLPWLNRFLSDFYILDKVRFRVTAMRELFGVITSRFVHQVFHDPLLSIFYFAIVLCSLVYGFILFRRRNKLGLVLISLAAIFLSAIVVINHLTAGINDDSRARYSFPYIFPVFILAGFFLRKMHRAAMTLTACALLVYSAFVAYGYFRLPAQRFWPAQLAPLVMEAKEFPIPDADKVTIEIESGFFVPVFVYYFYGPAYFREVTFPFAGDNLRQLNLKAKTNYRAYSNIVAFKHSQFLHSIPAFINSDWLFLIYSNWLSHSWGKEFREAYEDKLRGYRLCDAITLIEKKAVGAFTLEIYKVKKNDR